MLINRFNQLANCIRFLSADAIQLAKSGHPGMVLGLADVMTVLYQRILRHDPADPHWHDRDRVILSNGHGSMLLYSTLYLSGYNWTIDELKQFRRLHSEAAGHPELDVSKGVEVTTGPLGQGLANAVGIAVARNRLQAIYDEDQFTFRTFCFVGDGCLMEGISHEVSALAPKLMSSGLIVIWDDNSISIDGRVDGWFENDVKERYRSYGFDIIENVDGHDEAQIEAALKKAISSQKPCFIQMKTIIGKGCKVIEGSAKAHGQPLGDEAIESMRHDLEWPHKPFDIPNDLLNIWRTSRVAITKSHWQPPTDPDHLLQEWLSQQVEQGGATRSSSAMVLKEISKSQPMLIGGSADLQASNLTKIEEGYMSVDNHQVRSIAFGVREFGMFAIANGLALTYTLPFVATFLTFMDYGRNALRMAALMRLRVVYIMTHDSIGLGEDGPTHQPVEHLTVCRATPNVELWRPCNLHETAVAWMCALQHKGPTVLALSRQKIPKIDAGCIDQVIRGGYLIHAVESPQLSILATGSEVALAQEVIHRLKDEIAIDLVSIPCLDRFERADNQADVLRAPRNKRIIIEAGSKLSWGQYALKEHMFTVDDFGLSGQSEELFNHFGLSVETIVMHIRKHFCGRAS